MANALATEWHLTDVRRGVAACQGTRAHCPPSSPCALQPASKALGVTPVQPSCPAHAPAKTIAVLCALNNLHMLICTYSRTPSPSAYL